MAMVSLVSKMLLTEAFYRSSDFGRFLTPFELLAKQKKTGNTS